MNRYKVITPIMLYHLDEEYYTKHPEVSTKMGPIDLTKVLRSAKQNHVLYEFCKRMKEKERKIPSAIDKILTSKLEEGEIKLKKFKRTLAFLSNLKEERDLNFLFIKLYTSFTPINITEDIDILVRNDDCERLALAFKKNGAELEYSGTHINCKIEGLLPIDLYFNFCYFSSPFLDPEFLWRNPKEIEICGSKCLIPDGDADLLLLLIHALLGHRTLTIADFLHAKCLLQRTNLDELLRQTEVYSWKQAFLTVLNDIKVAYKLLYESKNIRSSVDFPIFFSLGDLVRIFGGFSNIPLGRRSKFDLIYSLLTDSIFRFYDSYRDLIPITTQQYLKQLVRHVPIPT